MWSPLPPYIGWLPLFKHEQLHERKTPTNTLAKHFVVSLHYIGYVLSSQPMCYRNTPGIFRNRTITREGPDRMKTKLSTSSDAGMNRRQARTRSMIASLPLLFSIAFLIFASCAGPTSTQTTTPQQTPTAQSIPASPASTPQLTQQYEFKEQDSGRTVTFTVTSRFQIILDQQKYPKKNVQVSCTPPETLGSVSNLPAVAPPLYALRYEGVQAGLCTIKNGNFLLTVRIIS